MQSIRSLFLLLACAALTYMSALSLRNSTWEQREGWPPEIDTAMTPQMGPVLGALLGKEFAADIIWVRGLVYYGSAPEETEGYRQIESFINAIIDLDPHFYRPYRWAAYAVTYRAGTATHEEFEKSIAILERGMEAFPDRYEFFWLAGQRYYLDMNSRDKEQNKRWKERGAELIEQAMHKPDAPAGLASVAASLRSRLGQKKRAIDDLRQMVLLTDNPTARQRLLARLRALTGDEYAADIDRAAREFERTRAEHLPMVPGDLFVLLGGPPDPVIDLEQLATDRDLFGADL